MLTLLLFSLLSTVKETSLRMKPTHKGGQIKRTEEKWCQSPDYNLLRVLKPDFSSRGGEATMKLKDLWTVDRDMNSIHDIVTYKAFSHQNFERAWQDGGVGRSRVTAFRGHIKAATTI